MRCRALFFTTIAVIVVGKVAAAQTASSSPKASDHVEVRVGYEAHRDHLRYTFENPSNIDTDVPVPHAFTQQYIASNQWVFGTVRYPLRGDVMQTEFAISPPRRTAGSDLDTFYDPNHDVVVSGTDGDVTFRSLRFTQWSEGRLFGLPWRVGYTYRRDHAQFLPTDRIVTHTNPPSEVRSPTFGHETTISQTHEIPVNVSRPVGRSSHWRVTPSGDLSPLILARLVTRLPDKYPGQDIVFAAKAIGLGAGLEVTHQQGLPLSFSLHYGQTWGYREAGQFRRDSLTVTATFQLK